MGSEMFSDRKYLAACKGALHQGGTYQQRKEDMETLIFTAFVPKGQKPQLPLVLGSNPEHAKVIVREEAGKTYLPGSMVKAYVCIDEHRLDSTRDWVSVEGGKFNQLTLFGSKPSVNPWADWVRRDDVQCSAVNHILRHRLSVGSLVWQALHFSVSLEDSYENWASVARVVLTREQTDWVLSKTFRNGKLSWLQVKAMPVRIAASLNYPRWRPPVPKPEFDLSRINTPTGLPLEVVYV